jgi:hypothetical protein
VAESAVVDTSLLIFLPKASAKPRASSKVFTVTHASEPEKTVPTYAGYARSDYCGPPGHHAGHVSGSPTGRNLPAEYGHLRWETQKNRGRLYAALSVQSSSDPVISGPAISYSIGADRQTRNPTLYLRSSGVWPPRNAARQDLGR